MNFNSKSLKYLIKVSFKNYQDTTSLDDITEAFKNNFNSETKFEINTSLMKDKVTCILDFVTENEYTQEDIEQKIEKIIYEDLDLTNYYTLSYSNKEMKN
ncbi:hypothetical protein [Cetobacterium sp. SF1]|uniref:hypothetical protein n=1 Tax=unclassified Cetobacterium TaxID=2630983 RepID=UPI003CE91567